MDNLHPYAPARWWRLVIRPDRGRAALALQVAGVSMVGVLIGEIWQLPIFSLIPIMAGALWQGNRMANMRTGLLFLVFFTVVSAALYVAALLTVNNFFATLAVNLVFSFVFFFLGTASTLGMISVIGGLILSYMLLTLDTLHDGDSVTRFILYTWLVFLIVSGLLGVVGSCFSPSPLRCLTDQIALRLELAGQCLALWGRGKAVPQGLREAVEDHVGAGVSGMFATLALARQERRWDEGELAWLRLAGLNSFAILQLVEQGFQPGEGLSKMALAKENLAGSARLAGRVEAMAGCIAAGRRPVADDLAREEKADDAAMAAPQDTPRAAKGMTATGTRLDAMSRLLDALTTPQEEREGATLAGQGSPAAQPKAAGKAGGFFSADAFTNPEHIRQAIKGTVSVGLAIVTYKLLNWPGVHTCIITCFIVSMPTMGAVLDKQIMRMLGALLGCGLSMAIIIWLMPHLTSIAQLLLAVGGVVFLGAWVKAGDGRISYVGLQIMVAFLLSDLAQYAPATDLTVPRDRIIGILIGLTISFAVHTLFWPRSATAGLDRQLDAVDGLLAEDVTGWGTEQRILQAARLQEGAAKAMQMLRHAMLEPRSMRPGPHRQRQYRAFLRQAVWRAGQLFGGEEVTPYAGFRLGRIGGQDRQVSSGREGGV